MALWDKWVALKIVEFILCAACLIGKRISTDDEARLALLLQKLSREWALLTSITWDSSGSAFADAIYGGYVIITFALAVGRVVQEVPIGRRVLEGILLGFGLIFFVILGGLELGSLDSVPSNLTANAVTLGCLSLIVAALFLVDLMGPRMYTSTRFSQTDPMMSPKTDKKVTILSQHTNGNAQSSAHSQTNGHGQSNTHTQNKQNNIVPAERPKTLDIERGIETKKDISSIENLKSLTLLEDLKIEDELEKSKFGSLRNLETDNYVRLSDPLADIDRYHYEQELAKFNDKYFSEYFGNVQERLPVKEKYLPELQAPVFAKVKSGRQAKSYSSDEKLQSKPPRARTVPTPTIQQLEDYLKGSYRSRRADTPAAFPMEPIVEKDGREVDGRASGTPTDPGYVQYTANRWPDRREIRTPRHSPTQ